MDGGNDGGRGGGSVSLEEMSALRLRRMDEKSCPPKSKRVLGKSLGGLLGKGGTDILGDFLKSVCG